MDQDRKNKKRTRDQGEEQGMKHLSEKKRAKFRQEQQGYTNDIMSSTSTSYGSPEHDSGAAEAQGVFDFPWLKDGVVAKYSDEWKFEELEDVFTSQLSSEISTTTTTTITTHAGIQLSFPGQCLCQTPVEAVLEFPDEKFDEEKECPLLSDYAFDTTESLDCIWGAL
ncbi:hypothetical protein L484_017958 [Morus notabilis]|uniref:Uncharacterized protein n=2 Tax=Morus notabilis TaxID=981085 RepID=W9R1X0_9ROSA|nr:uncharacterized protein LOC21400941 isoform X2 [Morus notabilis]EXB64626.1 hypothetical protein L484_017958 [Morus notabilis]